MLKHVLHKRNQNQGDDLNASQFFLVIFEQNIEFMLRFDLVEFNEVLYLLNFQHNVSKITFAILLNCVSHNFR
ncbi:hypothetical protein D3C86_1884200 [compost metagenome]